MPMLQFAWSRFALPVLIASLLLPMTGCRFIASRLAEQANADPNARPKIIEAAKSSCLKTSHDAFPQMANREAIIVDYCNCFSERGLNSFSNAELAEIGLRPGLSLTAEQSKKLDAAGDMCMTEANNKAVAPVQ